LCSNNPIWDDISRQKSVSKQLFPLAVKSWDPKLCQFLYQDSGEAAIPDNSKGSGKSHHSRRSKKTSKAKDSGKANECNDLSASYASETLKLGLFLMEFVDAIREGDGYRMIHY